MFWRRQDRNSLPVCFIATASSHARCRARETTFGLAWHFVVCSLSPEHREQGRSMRLPIRWSSSPSSHEYGKFPAASTFHRWKCHFESPSVSPHQQSLLAMGVTSEVKIPSFCAPLCLRSCGVQLPFQCHQHLAVYFSAAIRILRGANLSDKARRPYDVGGETMSSPLNGVASCRNSVRVVQPMGLACEVVQRQGCGSQRHTYRHISPITWGKMI